jgi:hypothetical protein
MQWLSKCGNTASRLQLSTQQEGLGTMKGFSIQIRKTANNVCDYNSVSQVGDLQQLPLPGSPFCSAMTLATWIIPPIVVVRFGNAPIRFVRRSLHPTDFKLTLRKELQWKATDPLVARALILSQAVYAGSNMHV